MAARRMFALSITSSDSFIEMSLECQAVYFQLGMNADDDGLGKTLKPHLLYMKELFPL